MLMMTKEGQIEASSATRTASTATQFRPPQARSRNGFERRLQRVISVALSICSMIALPFTNPPQM